VIAMTTTALATADGPEFDREWHRLIREVGTTLADPLTPTATRAAVKATVLDNEVFLTRTASLKTRADLARLNLTAGFGALINPAQRREVA
jgi:hypothetical protein